MSSRTKYTITEDSWRVLQKMGVVMEKKLEGENSDRNEDGTYTVELEDEFVVKLKVARDGWAIGESLDAFIKRRANRIH